VENLGLVEIKKDGHGGPHLSAKFVAGYATEKAETRHFAAAEELMIGIA
jgi:hypothetical protein